MDDKELGYFAHKEILAKVYGDAISFRLQEPLFGYLPDSIYKPPLGHFPD